MQTRKYAEALDQQRKMNDYMKSSFGTMTHSEKKLNKEGLHQFKVGNVKPVNYLVPGLADNSKGIGGSEPIKKKGHRGRNDSMRMSYDFNRAGMELTQGSQSQLHSPKFTPR